MPHPQHPRHFLATAPLRLALRLAFAAPLLALNVAPAAAQERTAYDVPAGPLAVALNRFAQQAGVSIAVDAGKVQGLRSEGLKGSYTVEEGFSLLLRGSGFTAGRSDAGYVLLPAAQPRQGAQAGPERTLAPVQVTAAAPQAESALEPVDGYIARRSTAGSRSDTPLVETPQSISVVTRDQVIAQKAVSVADTLVYTPGVAVQSAAFSRMVDDFTIRGFNVANGNLGSLRDGMKFQSNVYDGGQEPYGLERIEVVRGAASVLYGQLTPGGLVNTVSKRPTDVPLHEINLEYGSYDRKQLSADFGGPLSEDGSWSYRLTGLVREADNWVEKTDDDKTYIAPALTWRPSAATRLTLLSSYQKVDTRFSSPMLYQDVDGGTIPRHRFVGEPDFDRYKSEIRTVGYEFEHSFDNGLILRSAARRFEADVKWDYMYANLAAVSNGTLTRLASKRDEYSTGVTTDNSLQVSFDTGALRHTLLAGTDYYRRSYDSKRYRGTAYLALDLDEPVYSGYPNINYNVDRGSDNTGDQYGVYVQDQIRYGNWAFTVGGRHDRSESRSRSYQNGRVTKQSDEASTGRAGVVYLFDNGFAPYASFSQSFQPQIGTDSLTGAAFDPSRGRQYEIGLRYQPSGSALLLSGAVYDLLQTEVVTANASGNQYQQGKVRSRGAELEARWQGEAFGLIAAYTYTDAQVKESALPGEVGEQLAMVPYHALSLWADRKLGDLGLPGVKVGLGVRYIGETNIPGYSENVPAYHLVDALLAYDLGVLSPSMKGLNLALNARNMLDKKYYTCTAADGCRYGEPATWTATVSYRW